ncbi:energy transducer TonB [Pedobacter africanus]|uniref:Outer membrane transport energization protein TonB n=1 Tax=Pedobacter africanus TaxID=151894 RepID=A0A1W2DSH3_9SPHI|nr:energy transducer TonB [Pedobacter africanus]SMD00387.1 outer membrane transport energization protein TonB [Pedobacter africanus]
MMTYPKEENNYPKALAISTGIMALLIGLSFFIAIGTFQPEVEAGMGGIVVNYGTSVEGMGTDYTSIEEPSADPNANQQAPDKVVPTETTPEKSTAQTSDKEIVTQSTEDAVSVKTKSTKSTSTPVATTTESKPAKPTINQNALYKGKTNKGTGGGDGTGSTPGNQGSVNGDPLSNNYGEGGSGFGETPIALRKFTNLVVPQDDGQKTGKIAVRISINKNGVVIAATPGVKGTTLTDRELWQKCKDAVMGARLTQSESAPDVQIGVVVFNFKVK